MIEPMEKTHGVTTARCVCDDCGREEVIPAPYARSKGSSQRELNEGHALKKITSQHHWAKVKNVLRCPSCEAKRKAEMANEPKPSKPAAPKEPSRKEKREIIAALEDYYDLDAERYKGGETDETIAELLSVMPGWVSSIREELFGPDGANEDISELESKLSEIARQNAEGLKAIKAIVDKSEAFAREIGDMQSDLAKIKKAVGARKLAVAGVR